MRRPSLARRVTGLGPEARATLGRESFSSGKREKRGNSVSGIKSPFSENLAVGERRSVLAPLASSLNWLANHVVLFQYKGFIFVTYGLLCALGALAALWWMGVILMGQGLPTSDFALLALSGTLGVLLAARLAAIALDYRELLRAPLKTLRNVAFVSWGGFVAFAPILLGFSLAADFRFLLLSDALARSGPLGHAIGRLGCLSYGCCFGRPTRSLLAVRYTNPEAKAVRMAGLRGVPLHPVPLYEALLDIQVFALVNALGFLGAPQGVPTTVYLLVYGLGRFAIEFFRDNTGRMVWGPLAINHLLALGLAVAGAAFLPLVSVFQAASPAFSLGTALQNGLLALPILILCGGIVFLFFALHRGRVGKW